MLPVPLTYGVSVRLADASVVMLVVESDVMVLLPIVAVTVWTTRSTVLVNVQVVNTEVVTPSVVAETWAPAPCKTAVAARAVAERLRMRMCDKFVLGSEPWNDRNALRLINAGMGLTRLPDERRMMSVGMRDRVNDPLVLLTSTSSVGCWTLVNDGSLNKEGEVVGRDG